ncbi:COG3740 Phage head maturation protease [uncultured Caudovirales phage]|uniref:COG3740 Phage head maturation protease n=1 Tax=uncultured Caudovirales phage TaxID=2100421 RepID=A0A6J5KYU5_9CAUD|nr:COG3740 Phage head maturation protease [uncultured Caudovirales phage]
MTVKELKKKRGSRPIYFKAAATEVKVDANSRKVSGYAAIWGNVDDAGDMLIKGCCAKSIQERGPESATNRKVAFLNQHCMKEPIGRLTVLKEDEKGLYFEAILDEIQLSNDVLTQLKSGTLNQFSIGFLYVWDKCEWDNQNECLVVREINLWEVSVVTLGCNEETGFEGMKGITPDELLAELEQQTARVLKGFTWEDQMEIRALINKYIALNEQKPADGPLPPSGEPQKKGVDLGVLASLLS